MELSPEIIGRVFALPPKDRYELANQLLDSIDAASAADLDSAFVEEILRRRAEMLGGNEVVADWRDALSAIEKDLSAETPR